jgi:hypothetical protein
MTIEPDLRKALRRAAVRASRAPSVRNTEPWRFVLSAQSLELYEDPHRRLRVLDPRGRQLYLSCGCALFNARASLAFSGYRAVVARFPDAERPNLVARIRVAVGGKVDTALARMDPFADEPGEDRPGQSVADEIPSELVDALLAAGTAEGALVARITRAQDLATIERISTLVSNAGLADLASRAELRAWATGEVETVSDEENESIASDWGPPVRARNFGQCLLVIGGSTDDRSAWLHTGEALERMLLEVARWGYSASPMTQALETQGSYLSLREQLGLSMYPQALIAVRSGYPTPELRRRRLVDLLTETK